MANNLTTWQGFQAELQSQGEAIAAQLPNNIAPARFQAVAVAAVKGNPDLLQCTPRSLFQAISKAAQDGLLPDNREGVIVPYNEKIKGTNNWVKVAQWNPMAFGLRKKARELDGIIINAQVVYSGDEYDRCEGDKPRLRHKPAQLGAARGDPIGVYAIFRNSDEGILHREVMDRDEVDAVRSQSKVPNSLMWTKFWTEAWRKTVLRRGIKTVPCSLKLDTIIHRDDELFDLTTEDVQSATPVTKTGRAKAKVVQAGGKRALPPKAGARADEAETDTIEVEAEEVTAETVEAEAETEESENQAPQPAKEPAKKPITKKAATKKSTNKANKQPPPPKKDADKKSPAKFSDEELAMTPEEAIDNAMADIAASNGKDQAVAVLNRYRVHPQLEFPGDKGKLNDGAKEIFEELGWTMPNNITSLEH